MTNTVWVLNHEDHGVETYSGDTDPFEIPTVQDELGWLEGGYEEERDEFIDTVQRAIRKGYGTAYIEERFTLELQRLG